MDPHMRNLLIRILLISLLLSIIRFAYLVTLRRETLISSVPRIDLTAAVSNDVVRSTTALTPGRPDLWTTKGYREAVLFYSSIFQDLISNGFLKLSSKSLCVQTPTGQDVFALQEIGVQDSIGIARKASKPLVTKGLPDLYSFKDNTFDFVFSGSVDNLTAPSDFASGIARALKPGGFLVVHTGSRDEYSLNSFVDLFNCCRLVRSRVLEGFDSVHIREIVMTKEIGHVQHGSSSQGECSVPGYKNELVMNAEPLISEEPLKPWLTLKRNIKKVKYLPSMVDIGFKRKYVYIDVGARSYGSSIGSWFKKQYPKQNKTFDIYAIEADKTFHEQYGLKKGVTLLPYAAWVKNETLFFEINGDPGDKSLERGRGMGRIRPVQSNLDKDVDTIRGFDFADWLKGTVSERDFVVMKMDVEGTEFDLIPRLFETRAICLVDEIFLECHYSRWQRCCPGERSSKYDKSYDQCLDLFSSLRESGVLVHQWW